MTARVVGNSSGPHIHFDAYASAGLPPCTPLHEGRKEGTMSDERATTPEYPHLSDRQRARVEALTAARRVLVEQNFMKSGKADPTELVSLATYIETGADPYQSAAP